MEFTSFFLYKGNFAFYKISTIDSYLFFAHLVSYRGKYSSPPKYIPFSVEGDETDQNKEHRELLDNLRQAIEEHKQHNQLLFDANLHYNQCSIDQISHSSSISY
jgi:hypothetical protein